MALEEYKRKRRFEETPEPPPKVEKKTGHRFVVQMHRATRLHYDFRLELEGVLKSWAVPRGPSLDPADKRLAMMVEDHPVSYFDFEGNIPADNYGAGTVLVWDVGTWEPLSAVAVKGKYQVATDKDALAMLAKGDLKFRLKGKRLNGDFALVHIKSRRADSKGNEWLMIKKHDDSVEEGFDAEAYETSVLTRRTLDEIAGDAGSREWVSRPAGRGKLKAAWLADAVAKFDKKKREDKGKTKDPTLRKARRVGQPGDVSKLQGFKVSKSGGATRRIPPPAGTQQSRARLPGPQSAGVRDDQGSRVSRRELRPADKRSLHPAKGARRGESAVVPTLRKPRRVGHPGEPRFAKLPGAVVGVMPSRVNPMLAVTAEQPFDRAGWLFEIKWDGYRAVAFIREGKVRLVSRNQNDLTGKFAELGEMARMVKANEAVLDGEVVALDEQGRPSFSLMQQRTGFRPGGRRGPAVAGVPVVYYAFDLLYADGYDLRRVPLEQRKEALKGLLAAGELLRFSDHYVEKGTTLFKLAGERGLEGIVGKKASSAYVETRSSDWVKIKITRRLECVIGGYTDPEGSRDYFGSIVLGLYEDKGRLIHVGQAGSGFDQQSLKMMWDKLKKLESKKNPFYGDVDALRPVHFVKPELVAEIKFSEWTHESEEGGPKLRAPVFMGLREDKEAGEVRSKK
jgi:bifunctional non-homologous end joining protein LigD